MATILWHSCKGSNWLGKLTLPTEKKMTDYVFVSGGFIQDCRLKPGPHWATSPALFHFLFWDSVLRSCQTAQARLKLAMLLPQPLKVQGLQVCTPRAKRSVLKNTERSPGDSDALTPLLLSPPNLQRFNSEEKCIEWFTLKKNCPEIILSTNFWRKWLTEKRLNVHLELNSHLTFGKDQHPYSATPPSGRTGW